MKQTIAYTVTLVFTGFMVLQTGSLKWAWLVLIALIVYFEGTQSGGKK